MLFTFMLHGMVMAQSNYFNTVNEKQKGEVRDSTSIPIERKTEEQTDLKTFLVSLSLEELEYVTNEYKAKHPLQKKTNNTYKKSAILSMYNGESHELTIRNLLLVMDEADISNKLFVLAQSLLETGYFKSNASRNLHNLFGLTNPHTGKLYAFDRWESSVVAYKKFVQYKYKGGSYLSFLKRIGYAEDPRYISKVIRISRDINKEMCITD